VKQHSLEVQQSVGGSRLMMREIVKIPVTLRRFSLVMIIVSFFTLVFHLLFILLPSLPSLPSPPSLIQQSPPALPKVRPPHSDPIRHQSIPALPFLFLPPPQNLPFKPCVVRNRSSVQHRFIRALSSSLNLLQRSTPYRRTLSNRFQLRP
jgi:hypothetical protein